MARRRMIDPNFWQSEDVAKLTIRQRLLVIGLFSNADDEGKGRANIPYIRSIIFPYDDIPIKDLTQDLLSIAKVISILLYEVDSNSYYKFTNWKKWQRVDKPQQSLLPDAPELLQNDSRMIPESLLPKRKERKGKEINITLFNFWNSLNITVHTDLTDDIDKAIDKAFKKYSPEDIETAMTRYAEVYHNKNYYFDYKWTLVNFLTQRNTLPDFLDGGSKWIAYQTKKSKPSQTYDDIPALTFDKPTMYATKD